MKRYVLGVSGSSGSGKSEILKKLSNKINSNLSDSLKAEINFKMLPYPTIANNNKK